MHRSAILTALTVLAALPAHSLAAKTDKIGLVNGDIVTGEIKSLEFGTLSYSTDSMGTVSIDWPDIVTVSSPQSMQIETIDGVRYFGSLAGGDEPGTVVVDTGASLLPLPVGEVARMTPIDIDERLIARIDGSVSIGAQFQKSSEVTTSSVAADMSYRTRRYLAGARLNSTVTDQPTEETKARQSLQFNFQRFREDRWFTEWFAAAEKNDELGINSRYSTGLALGRYILQDSSHLFSITAGVQGARTTYIGEDDSDTVGEGRLEFRWRSQQFTNDSSLIFTSILYPEFNDLGEYRAETNMTLRNEIIEDFFFDITLGHSYVSDPPTDGESTDYVATTSVGYSF